MKVFIDTKPETRAACFQSGRRVKNLEWVSDPGKAEGMITDLPELIVPGKRTLYLGGIVNLFPLTDPNSIVNSTTVKIVSPYRADPRFLAVQHSLFTQELGAPALLRIHFWCRTPPHTVPRLNSLVTQLDVVFRLFADTPESLYTVGNLFEPTLQTQLNFPDGGVALLDFAWDLPEGDAYYSLSLIGDTGAAYADDQRNVNLLFAGNEPRAKLIDPSHEWLDRSLENFVNPTPPGERSFLTVNNALVLYQFAEKVLESHNRRAPVSIFGTEDDDSSSGTSTNR